MEESEQQHPLLAARPPETDYITYLTIVEYNLTKENLPVLHHVLQDIELNSHIGWDLVHLLLPLLPESQECLQDIARLGNPREVVLKVTEALRALHFNDDEDELEEEEDLDPDRAEKLDEAESSAAAGQCGPLTCVAEILYEYPVVDRIQDRSMGDPENSNEPQAQGTRDPLPVQQFQALLSMLAVLHPRVKTKYPSRFLSTSLQAVLASYDRAISHRTELTNEMIHFVKTVSGTKRPHLPHRMSSGHVPITSTAAAAETAVSDPEAEAKSPSEGESKMVRRLLQAFLTHVLEDYARSLSSNQDVPGLCWSSRLQEKLFPDRVIPTKASFTELFANEADLKDRSLIVGQIVALAQDLELQCDDLHASVMDENPEPTGIPSKTDDPPESADDIPFSKTGSLLLLTARTVAEKLFGARLTAKPLPIFPDHAIILNNFVNPAVNMGMEHESVIDALLALGLTALEEDHIGEPVDDEQFTRYLQATSLVSSTSPSPSLRFHAYYLTLTVLRSHPSDIVRLSFIRDTLEYCPFENLKTSAVGWLKGETLEANMPSAQPTTKSTLEPPEPGTTQPQLSATSISPPSIFATPVALSTCSPFLFPDLTHDLKAASLSESYDTFKLNLSFYLATLNFYYLLLTAEKLYKVLDIAGLHETADVGGSYLAPLKDATSRFGAALKQGGELYEAEGEEGAKQGVLYLQLLEDVIARVEEGVKKLNKEG